MLSLLISYLSLLLLMLLLLSVDPGHALASRGRSSQRQPKPKGQIGGGGGFGSPPPRSKPVPKKATYVVDTSDTIKALLDFLDEEECEGLEVTDVGITTKIVINDNDNDNEESSFSLRGIFAKEDIQAGEYICAVPFVSTLLVDEQFIAEGEKQQEELLLSSSDRIEHGQNFLNKFVNDPKQKEFFQAYLDCLPQYDIHKNDPNFDATPEFWSDSDIQQLEVPTLVDDMLKRKRQLHELAAAAGDDNDDSESAVDTLKHAAWIVRSRAFTTLKKAMTLDGTEGLLQRTVLIPYFDLINHCDDDTVQNAEMQVVETKEYDESFYALVANRFIPKGTEIRIMYGTGQETTLDLFAKYGFLPKGNEENDRRQLLGVMDLDHVEWSTTLEEDEAMLKHSSSSSSSTEGDVELSQTMRTILNLRTYLKRLQRENK